MLLLIVSFVFAIAYLWLQLHYRHHWRRIAKEVTPADFVPVTPVTVLVVAHNEEEHIFNCIQSILRQDYPAHLLEIIVVNDRSSDKTVDMIRAAGASAVSIFHLTEHPDYIYLKAFKKSAITLGVTKATHEWIIQTDADCVHEQHWLKNIAYAIQKTDAVFLASPLVISGNNNSFTQMQEFESIALMTITGAGIHSGIHDLANGANMAYAKAAFYSVNGFEGNYEFPSGDDMFLIEKMRASFPGQIAFVKNREAVAFTFPKLSWQALFQQRRRWAGKNKGLKNPLIPVIWNFIGAYHVLLVLTGIIMFFIPHIWLGFISLLLIKWIADYLLFREGFRFLQKTLPLLKLIRLEWMYGIFILRMGVRIFSSRQNP